MKTTLTVAALACVALFISGCGSSPQDLIVGKWESEVPGGAKLTAEFGKDGKAKLTMPALGAVEGTYKVNGDELEWNGKKYKMKLSATELELTDQGKTIKYKKV
jgi:uncharacterized protein (TIGR03066 family)